MINTRPKIVEKKRRIGDLEIDTVIGKDRIGALITVVEGVLEILCQSDRILNSKGKTDEKDIRFRRGT